MSVGKLGILAYLAGRGPATASTLATAETVSPQAIATAVRELHTLGLVAKTPDTDDRRRQWIEITEAGRRTLAEERSRGLEWLAVAIDTRLTPREQSTLAEIVPILRTLVDESDA
ncbi:MarR family transcriptional regulator [Rhodococcus sp. 14-2496-1d]|nr:MarR family transcriptional regulator [Rhodococcus sp. 14-2496-1d]